MISLWIAVIVVCLINILQGMAIDKANSRIAILEEKLERLHPWDWELSR